MIRSLRVAVRSESGSRTRTCIAALIAILMLPGTASAVVVDEIRFAGNDKTQPSTMLQEILISPGDDVSDAQIETARQSIMDLGLFKSVETEVREENGRNILRIAIKEKHYWFVLPRLSRSGDGDISYGAAMRLHNVRGRNQTLIIGAKRTELTDADLEKRDEVTVRYNNPRLFGSAFELSTRLKYEQSELDDDRGGLSGAYSRNLAEFQIGVSRWFEPGPSRGWRAGIEATLRDYDHELLRGDAGLYTDATILSLAALLEYYDVHDRLYSRSGVHFGYELMGASDSFVSDAGFTRHTVFFRRYMPIGDVEHTNLNIQLRAGYANRTVFGDPAHSLGGSSSLRGFDRDSVEGNAFVLANIEYLRPLFGKQNIRGVLFADIGNAYDTVNDVDLGDLRYALGVGLRWRLESFVKTELRIDFVKGFDDGVEKVYASTKATF